VTSSTGVEALLKHKVAVVTGGARGIGLATARRLIDHGARVVIGDVDEQGATASARELGSERCAALSCDVTDPSDVDALVAFAISTFGSLDVMVNNAGVTRDATLRKMTLAEFETVIDVHLKGAWLGTRAASLVMRERGSGAIVNISSIAGKVGAAGQTNYSAAKAGIVGLTKAAAKELGHLGIRVNAIAPGLIRTPMTAALREDIFEAKLAEVPLQRAGEPEEIGDAVVFLASPLASYVSGAVIEVTGGRHL
jgi:3-oxoacyl-[acyl-carrier protein] reductase